MGEYPPLERRAGVPTSSRLALAPQPPPWRAQRAPWATRRWRHEEGPKEGGAATKLSTQRLELLFNAAGAGMGSTTRPCLPTEGSKDMRTDEERAALLAWADNFTACDPYKPELEELELSPPGDTRNAPSSPEGPPMATLMMGTWIRIECPVVNAQPQQVQAQLAALLAVVAGGDASGTSVAPFLAAVVGGPALTPDTVTATATDGPPPTSSGFLYPGRGRIGQIVL
ncbi:hypothetical protein EDB86DRAFT_2827989 [Lactarius hatsudake]|nr:hypothetical protein EDB86DRAFT_2827989 [Lactarius hatsudake]